MSEFEERLFIEVVGSLANKLPTTSEFDLKHIADKAYLLTKISVKTIDREEKGNNI